MLATGILSSTISAPTGLLGRASAPPRTNALWTATTVLRRGPNHQEAYAIGPDGFVWSHETGSEGQATGRLISTGLKAHSFAPSQLPNQRALVIGVLGNSASYVMETGTAAPRWSPPAPLKCVGLRKATAITEVHTLEHDGKLLIGLLARHRRLFRPDSYQFWVGAWTGDQVEFRRSPVGLDGEDPLGNAFLFSHPAKKTSFNPEFGMHWALARR
jgi:hypothetical protein